MSWRTWSRGRLIVVASARGTLDHLDPRIAGRFAEVAARDLDAVDALVEDWRRAVHAGRAEADSYGRWLNIPSKVAQVAAFARWPGSVAPTISPRTGCSRHCALA